MNIRRTTGRDPDFIALTKQLDAELRAEYGPAQFEYAKFNLVDTETAIVIELDGAPVACGCFKPFDDAAVAPPPAVELKRMFVDPAHRGTGLGRALVGALETWARERDVRTVVLETGIRQHAAVALYERIGYQRIPLYGPYIGMDLSICMRKSLA